MLNSINSLYFIKILFTYLNEKEKLRIIKYNKSFQKKLDISLINYKFFGEKYIIYESKGKGKEYNRNDNALIFEGEYKNGERNGKGEEYDNDGFLIFKGEYKNGKRNGKGKEFSTCILKFEGEYENGLKVNIKMVIEMEKEKNILIIYWCMKVNI